MAKVTDPLRKRFGPLRDKTLENALAHRIGTQFPNIGGPRIRQLCAEMILEVVRAHVRPRNNVRHGQVVWTAVARDDPPRRGQRIAETELIPVVLDVFAEEDLDAILDRRPARDRLLSKLLRLCRQAYEQGGLLSNCDLAALLNVADSHIGTLLSAHERQTDQVVPRRATLHDVGSGLTHKRIICLKRFAEGKSPQRIAKETHHSQEAVDHYLSQYDRVRCCRLQGMTPEETAYMLQCSLSLVQEYLRIDRELEQEDA